MIEDHAKLTNQKCTDILMGEWCTSGRVRPTLSTLKELLIKAQIFRAADEVAKILNDPIPERPNYGPGALVPVNVTEILHDTSTEQGLNDVTTAVKSNGDLLCNESTRQIKSVSDMIKFSTSCNAIAAETNQQSFGNKTTIQIKSVDGDDLIKFSKVTQESTNMPHLSVMLPKTTKTSQQSTSSTIESPNKYQRSFPNINMSAIFEDRNLISFDYGELEYITGNFSEVLIDDPSGLKGRIGSGGFGDVFLGRHLKYGLLAVKKAHSHITVRGRPEFTMETFNAEVKFLSQFRHNNIVPIWGFSMNGPVPCVVCEYIDGGSLQQNLEAKTITDGLQRLNIMTGTAEGLKYLHTSDKSIQTPSSSISDLASEADSQNSTHFVHRDVKSANILLTRDFVPKLCDFGLAKQYESTFVTTCLMGTSAYMAPEGLYGTITQKIDIFSFGIVLLELLTGLKPIVQYKGEDLNIKHYVEDIDEITPLLDKIVKTWVRADDIYNLAKKCIKNNRKSRPTIVEVCDILNEIKNC